MIRVRRIGRLGSLEGGTIVLGSGRAKTKNG